VEGAWVEYDVLCARVTALVGEDSRLRFSAYGSGRTQEDGTYMVEDNLDDIAIEGDCIVIYDGGWGESYTHPESLTDPTWADLCKVAHAAIEHSGDKHHSFLEGVRRSRQRALDLGTQEDVPVYELHFGS
jgi:hypothetical protein